ncbi:MAG: hypothetical protein ABEK59_06770 [Halobacteria archaeon]
MQKRILPTQVRERYQNAIEKLTETNTDKTICIPKPEKDDPLQLSRNFNLASIEVTTIKDQPSITTTLYFDDVQEKIDREIVPDDLGAAPDSYINELEDKNPSYLRDLGGKYRLLSDTLIGDIEVFAGIPDQDGEYPLDKDFICSQVMDGKTAVFLNTANYRTKCKA